MPDSDTPRHDPAQYIEWVRSKIDAARADPRPGMTSAQVLDYLGNRVRDIRSRTSIREPL